MASKNQVPVHVLLGLSEPPPAVRGYRDYGCVYRAADGPQRESLRHAWGVALWSWKYWGRKVRRDCRIVREQKRAARITRRREALR
jgi:hypothetical protein